MESDDFLIIAENLTIVYRREVRFFGKSLHNGTATLRAETASGSIVLSGPHHPNMIDNCLAALAQEIAQDKPVIKMRDISARSAAGHHAHAHSSTPVKACG